MARHRARWQGHEGEQDAGPAFAALPAGRRVETPGELGERGPGARRGRGWGDLLARLVRGRA